MITRRPCPTCAADTLHGPQGCVHCATPLVAIAAKPTHPREVRSYSMPRMYLVPFRGELLTLRQIAGRSGLSYPTVTYRYRAGVRGEALAAAVPPMMARAKGKKA